MTYKELKALGYTFENGTLIEGGIRDMNGVATVSASVLLSDGGACSLGGNACGRFIPGDSINGSAYGLEALLWLMAVVGVEHSHDIDSQYVRVAFNGDRAEFIGHITKDIWFSFDRLAEAHKC